MLAYIEWVDRSAQLQAVEVETAEYAQGSAMTTRNSGNPASAGSFLGGSKVV